MGKFKVYPCSISLGHVTGTSSKSMALWSQAWPTSIRCSWWTASSAEHLVLSTPCNPHLVPLSHTRLLSLLYRCGDWARHHHHHHTGPSRGAGTVRDTYHALASCLPPGHMSASLLHKRNEQATLRRWSTSEGGSTAFSALSPAPLCNLSLHLLLLGVFGTRMVQAFSSPAGTSL